VRLTVQRRLALAALAAASAVTLALPAQASAAPAAGPLGLTPAPGPGGQPRSYLQLSISPGGAATATAIVSNEGTRTQRLRITVSRGVTAANSGSAFVSVPGRCAAASCWLTRLPRAVTLGPGERRMFAFQVAVPRRTRPGQYLAGITAQSASAER
jgi:hypothetical protein